MYFIGVDLGGTNIKVGLVDAEGRIIRKDSVPTFREREYPEIIKDTAVLIEKVVKDAGLALDDIESIGFASPGIADAKNGVLVYANNLKFFNVPIRKELKKYINKPIYLENDANAAGLAECVVGAAKGVANSITVTLGTGVGSGIVIDGKVYSGFNNAGAELGHMVIAMDGEQCSCGRKGCFEAYGSATALIGQAKKAAVENPDSKLNSIVNGNLEQIEAKTAFDAAHLGDEVALKVIDKYITYLAEGLANIINIFQPEVLCIGGGVCMQGEYLLAPLRKKVFERAYGLDSVPKCDIRLAQMGNDAGIIGAAMLGKI